MGFPGLREALVNRVPIKTDARSCTILPNFVGCVIREMSWKEGETHQRNQGSIHGP